MTPSIAFRVRSLFLPVTAALLLCLPAFSNPNELAPTAQITRSGDVILLHVKERTDLYQLLQVMCQQGSVDCEVAAEAKTQLVAPGDLRGTWEEVLTTLLQGAHLNFVLLRPAAKQRGRLLVESRRSDSVVQPAGATQSTPVVKEAAAANVSVVAEQPSSPTPTSAQTEEQPYKVSDNQPAVSNAASPALDENSSQGALPWPDAHGNAVMVQPSPDAGAALPWPDAQGRPVPVQLSTDGSAALPWPDAHGNPVPVTIQPGDHGALPWPDAKGRPVYITPH